MLAGTGIPFCQGLAGEKVPQLAGEPAVGFGSVFSERGLQTFIVPPATNSIMVGPV